LLTVLPVNCFMGGAFRSAQWITMVAVIFKIVGKNYGTYCGSFLHGAVCTIRKIIYRKVRIGTSLVARKTPSILEKKSQPAFNFTILKVNDYAHILDDTGVPRFIWWGIMGLCRGCSELLSLPLLCVPDTHWFLWPSAIYNSKVSKGPIQKSKQKS
jgi:hypothetical protein